ncbi:MAG: hypothetical protein E6686_07135 [Lachnospiraceae bacterium]|nr:hypothetical protein [Lachnospiraceae bacterium]
MDTMTQCYNEYYNENVKFEVTYLPKEPMQRESMCKRLQTELMSGKGKDIYLMSEWSREFENATGLFGDPNKLMYNGVLADMTEWTKKDKSFQECFQPVMEAGQADGKQYLLPITFRVPMLMREERGTDFTEETLKPLVKLIDEKSELLQEIAPYMFIFSKEWIGNCIDYEKQKVTVSEKEIEKVLRYEVEKNKKGVDGSKEKFVAYLGDFRKDVEKEHTIAIGRNCKEKERAYQFARLFWQKDFAEGTGIKIDVQDDSSYRSGGNVIYEMLGVPVCKTAWEEWALNMAVPGTEQQENTPEQIEDIHRYLRAASQVQTARFISDFDITGNEVQTLFIDEDGYTFRTDFPDIEERVKEAAKILYRNAYYIAME